MNALETPEEQSSGVLSVLVLGGYGLIGAAVMRRLSAAGHRVIGVGRSGVEARRSAPDAEWEIFDIATMSVEGWKITLRDVDVLVNASGALQSGTRDNLKAIHETALARMGEALQAKEERAPLFVQISAAGVSADASTEFFRSKARGEAAYKAFGLPMVILRPSLVLAPAAYGGTALLRAAAAIPFVLPNVLPEARIACVHIDDLAQAVLDAVETRIEPGSDVDVTGAGTPTLPDLLARFRAWLGIAPAWARLPIPRFALSVTARTADLLGWMGWRSPLRSTALQVLRDGVQANPEDLPQAGGTACRDLDAIFRDLPATLQDRWFARMYLLFPAAILTLSLFWIASGLIGLISFEAARSILTARGWGDEIAGLTVLAGAILDISLGVLVLWRSKLRRALWGMIALSLAYLTGATLIAPDLWADPLGPLVKVIPGMLLALIVLALADER